MSAEATALLAGVEPVLYAGFARTASSPEGDPVYLFVSSSMAWVAP